MSLDIRVDRCEKWETFTEKTNYAMASWMYVTGVGQIRDEQERIKFLRRATEFQIATGTDHKPLIDFLEPLSRDYIGCHTNVSDVTDFQWGKKLLTELRDTSAAIVKVSTNV